MAGADCGGSKPLWERAPPAMAAGLTLWPVTAPVAFGSDADSVAGLVALPLTSAMQRKVCVKSSGLMTTLLGADVVAAV